MIVGIIGSRRRNTEEDKKKLISELARLERKTRRFIKKIVTGDCDEGGDKFAREIADTFGYELEVKHIIDPDTGEEMDFKNHRWFNYFRMCNIFYTRDKEIVKEPLDYLIALVAPDRTGGTGYTINYFVKCNEDWKERLVLLL